MTFEKDGVRVTLINVCEHEYTYATETRVGARPFDEFETMQDIREAKKDADYVIVVYHGGKELCQYPSPRLMKACREMNVQKDSIRRLSEDILSILNQLMTLKNIQADLTNNSAGIHRLCKEQALIRIIIVVSCLLTIVFVILVN